MTIGINGWFVQFPYTGIGQYTAELLREFSLVAGGVGGAASKSPTDDSSTLSQDAVSFKSLPGQTQIDMDGEKVNGGNVNFIVAVPDESLVARVQEITSRAPHITCVCVRAIDWLPAGLRKHWWEQVQVPMFFARQKIDVAFFPYPAMPLVSAFRMLRFRTVVTIHDTIPWTDARYRRGILSTLAHMLQRRLAPRADRVITVSRASATTIMEVCGVPAERITVIPNGVDAAFCEKPLDTVVARACAQFGVTRDGYFLYVGGYDVRKRVDLLVQSFLRYANPEQKLVLVGGAAHETALYASPRIIKTGFIDDQTLAALYGGARAFVHFSQQEGFNIPLAQALSIGVPILVSDSDVHREVAHEHAWYTEPTDELSLMRGWQMITDGAPATRDGASVPHNNMRSPCNCTGAHRIFSWHEAALRHLLTLRLTKA